jgi:hypothetical protein
VCTRVVAIVQIEGAWIASGRREQRGREPGAIAAEWGRGAFHAAHKRPDALCARKQSSTGLLQAQ